MDAEQARRRLLAQHETIREQISRCIVFARRYLCGENLARELDVELDTLRSQFSEHNALETRLVGPLLHDCPDWGALLIDRMLEEHLAEHAAFWDKLHGRTREVAARIEELGEELDAHMAAEERTFLSPQVLHPDAISRHRG